MMNLMNNVNKICILNGITPQNIFRCFSSSSCVNFNNNIPYEFANVHVNNKRHLFSSAKPNWDRAVNEAEKIIGYPPSFANLRWLLSDEIANVAIHLRKLVGTDHPILKTAKQFLYSDKNNAQAWGLVVLLVSKAIGYADPQNDKVLNGEVLHNQRKMAEIIEMIRTGNLLHKSLLNFVNEKYSNDKDTLNFGNKVALLTGDYLLVTANGILSNMKNQHLSELISSALRDLTECEFVGKRDTQNFPLPSNTNRDQENIHIKDDEKTKKIIGYERKFETLDSSECLGNPVREWTLRNVLGGGSLLGSGCECAVHLAGHNDSLQKSAYLFGCHLSLAWQAAFDYNAFVNKDTNYSLVSAPVLFAIEEDERIYKDFLEPVQNVNEVPYQDLTNAVRKGSALDKTIAIINYNSQAAVDSLKEFPVSKATSALKKLADVLVV